MNLSIIIPTTGKPEILDPTLDLVAQAIIGLDIEVIVVDDSIDQLVELKNPDFMLLRTGGLGASNARNAGLAKASAELLLFLDDDIWISRENILRTLELHKEGDSFGYNFYWQYPKELKAELKDSKFGNYMLDKGLYSNAHRLDYNLSLQPSMIKERGLSSQYFSIRKSFMKQVGGYDDIPFAGIEDLLLFEKLEAVGVEIFLSQYDRVFQNESNRISVDALMSRYRTGALTRRIASLRGNDHMGLKLSGTQLRKAKMAVAMEPLIRWLLDIVPYGPFYRRCVHALLLSSSYKGFHKDPLPARFAEEFN